MTRARPVHRLSDREQRLAANKAKVRELIGAAT